MCGLLPGGRWFQWLLGALLLGGIVPLAGCQPTASTPAAPPPTPPPPAVRVAPVTRGDVASSLSYAGEVRASTQVMVVPKVSGRIERMPVEVGSVVKAGDVIAELDQTMLDAQVAQAEAALKAAEAQLASLEAGARPETVAQAEANLQMARARLAALQDGPREEVVAQAQASLDAARARLAQLRAGPTPDQIEAAKLGVDQARNALFGAQVARDGVCGNAMSPGYLCDAEQAKVNAATTALEQAEKQLAILTAPPRPEEVAQLEAAVVAAEQELNLATKPVTEHDLDQARAAVTVAEQQLALARKPYTEQDLQAARAAVDQARAALDLARLQKAEATVLAPIDGVVTDQLLAVGSIAGPTTPIVTIVSRDVKIAFSVEESRLGLVQPGQEAQVTVSAFPDRSFVARVKATAPTVESRSRTATVELVPDDPDGLLRPGMFAQVNLTTASRQGALLVPKSALIERDGVVSVFVVVDGVLRRQEIVAGLSDGDRVEVVQGLEEGQEVALDVRPDLEDGDVVLAQRG